MRAIYFYLGPAPSTISTRQLTIARMPKAGDDTMPSAVHNADAGDVEEVAVNLPNNQIYQAKLVDTLSSGEVSAPKVLNFNTGSLQYPGPGDADFRILGMEDLSSSSSSSSASSASSESSASSQS